MEWGGEEGDGEAEEGGKGWIGGQGTPGSHGPNWAIQLAVRVHSMPTAPPCIPGGSQPSPRAGGPAESLRGVFQQEIY